MYLFWILLGGVLWNALQMSFVKDPINVFVLFDSIIAVQYGSCFIHLSE